MIAIVLVLATFPMGAARAEAPSEPQAFSAEGTQGAVALSWEAPAWDGGHPIENYLLFRWDESASASILIANLSADTFAFTDDEARLCVAESYEILAVNAQGGGALAYAGNASHAGVPCPPRLYHVALHGAPEDVLAAWVPPASNGTELIHSYEVDRSDDGGPFVTIGSTGVWEWGFIDEDLLPGVYAYRVRAISTVGSSDPSQTLEVEIDEPMTPPGAPRALVAAPSADGEAVDLAWQAPLSDGGSPILFYQVERSDDGGIFAIVASTAPEHPNFTDTNVESGIVYEYRVLAVNDVGPSEPSESASIELAPTAPPSAPQAFEASSQVYKVLLTWQPPLEGARFENFLLSRQLESGEFMLIANLSSDNTSFEDWLVPVCQMQTYELRAVNMHGAGEPAYAAAAPHPGLPCAPRFLTATPAAGPRVDLSWSPPLSNGTTQIVRYDIERSIDGGIFALIGAVDPTTFEFTDEDPQLGHDHTYRVRAANQEGSSDPAESETLHLDTPSAPRNLTAKKVLLQGIRLSWEAPASPGTGPVEEYHVYRAVDHGASALLATTAGLSYTDASCPIGAQCLYRVSATNFLGEGPRSNGVSVLG